MVKSSHFFIGISVSEDIKKELSQWQSVLRDKLGSNYQIWTYKEDLHITLKFLGEVNRNELEILKKELRNQVEISIFSLEIGGVGTFGKPRKPRVLWAGVEKNKPLDLLKEQVEKAASAAGLEEDNQPYRPHVTLAKKWKGEKLSKETFAALTDQFNKPMNMQVTSFSLFRIHPSSQPKYEEVMKIELE